MGNGNRGEYNILFGDKGIGLVFLFSANFRNQRLMRKDSQRQLLYYVNLIRACLNFDQFDHHLVYVGPRICVV